MALPRQDLPPHDQTVSEIGEGTRPHVTASAQLNSAHRPRVTRPAKCGSMLGDGVGAEGGRRLEDEGGGTTEWRIKD
jgi:hypothetical protein